MDERTPGIRPRPSRRRRLDTAFRAGFPALSAALLLMLGAAPLRLPAQAQTQQALLLGCVFFWALYRPASVPGPVVFLLGLLADLLGLLPPGTTALALLLVLGLVRHWRRGLARRGFLVVWLVFGAMAGGVAALEWASVSLLALRPMPPAGAVIQFALSAGLYPALAILLTRAHRSIAAPELA